MHGRQRPLTSLNPRVTLGNPPWVRIATQESLAAPGYRQMVVDAAMDDIVLTRALTGLPASWLRASLEAAGLDLTQLPEHLSPDEARQRFGADASGPQPARWADIWSAGHSCSGVRDVPSVAALVARLKAEYDTARDRTAELVN